MAQRVEYNFTTSSWVNSGPALATTAGLTKLGQRFEVADTPALAGTDATGASTLIVQHPVRGGVLTRDATQTGVAVPGKRFQVGGQWFSRSAPPKEWRLRWVDIAGDYGGDAAAAIMAVVARMRVNDVLYLDGLDQITFNTSCRVLKPITIRDPDVRIVYAGPANLPAFDLRPEFLDGNGVMQREAGSSNGTPGYDVEIPYIQRDYGAYGAGTMLRIANQHHSVIDTYGGEGFEFGLLYESSLQAADTTDVGVSYTTTHQRGALRNINNILFRPNPAGDTPAHQSYVNHNTVYAASLTTPGGSADMTGSKHIYFEASQTGRCYNNIVHAPALEGTQQIGIKQAGYAHENHVLHVTYEMPNVTSVIITDPGAPGLEVTDGAGLTAFLRKNPGYLVDQAHYTRISGTGQLGYSEYYDGIWTIRRSPAAIENGSPLSNPVNWKPEDLREEPVLSVYWDGVSRITLDLAKRRRFQIEPNVSPAVYPANIVDLIGLSDALEIEVEIAFYVPSGASSISPYVVNNVKYGPNAVLTSTVNVFTAYRLRRMLRNGAWVWVVVARWDY